MVNSCAMANKCSLVVTGERIAGVGNIRELVLAGLFLIEYENDLEYYGVKPVVVSETFIVFHLILAFLGYTKLKIV